MILTILAWIGIGVALFILVLMVIPIRIFAGGTIDDHKGFEYQLVIDWALGLFSIRVQSGRSAGIYFTGLRLCPVPFKPSREKKQKEPNKAKPPLKTWITWIRGNFTRINDVLSRFARAIFLQGDLSGKIGLADPADTSIINFLGRLLQVHARHFNLSLTTVYEYEIIHIRAQVQSTLIIGYLGFVALGLLLNKQVWAMLRSVPKTKYKEDAL